LLLRMLASTLRRHRRDRALEDLQQRLLYTFARHVARDAWILRLPRDLVDLVDVDDASLALGDVEVACLEEADENVLHVLADLALLVLGEDLVTKRDALVADVDGWSGDELPDRILRLPAERAAEMLIVRHGDDSTRGARPLGSGPRWDTES